MVRILSIEDVSHAIELSKRAGWNQTALDWRSLIELEPAGCFAIERDGKVVATTTLICYGNRLAWLGMVLTHVDYQRRGFARELVTRALQWADERGILTVKLDATNQGLRLYESLGFRAEQEVERWAGIGSSKQREPGIQAGHTTKELDFESFQADRSRLLSSLEKHGQLMGNEDGFVLSRPGSRATYIGPGVARNPEAARRLIQACVAAQEGPCFWDVLSANRNAVAMAREEGFRMERGLVRMYRGAELRQGDSTMYAIAGFEFG